MRTIRNWIALSLLITAIIVPEALSKEFELLNITLSGETISSGYETTFNTQPDTTYLVTATLHGADVAIAVYGPEDEQAGPNHVPYLFRGKGVTVLDSTSHGAARVVLTPKIVSDDSSVTLRVTDLTRQPSEYVQAWRILDEHTVETDLNESEIWAPRIQQIHQACDSFERMELPLEAGHCRLIGLQQAYYRPTEFALVSTEAAALEKVFSATNLHREAMAARFTRIAADAQVRFRENSALGIEEVVNQLRDTYLEQLDSGSAAEAAWTQNELANLRTNSQENLLATQHAESVLEICRAANIKKLKFHAYYTLHISAKGQGNLRQAAQGFRSSIRDAASDPKTNTNFLRYAWDELGQIYLDLGRMHDAIDALHTAWTYAENAIEPDQARVLNRLAKAYLMTGNLDRAQVYLDQVKQLPEELAEVETSRMSRRVLAAAEANRGNIGTAYKILIEEQKQSSDPAINAEVERALSKLSLLRNKPNDARSHAENALAITAGTPQTHLKSLVNAAIIELQLDEPRFRRIRNWLNQAQRLLSHTEHAADHTDLLLAQSMYERATGNPQAALVFSKQATEALWTERFSLASNEFQLGIVERSAQVLDEHMRNLLANRASTEDPALDALQFYSQVNNAWRPVRWSDAELAILQDKLERLRELDIAIKYDEEDRAAQLERENLLRDLDVQSQRFLRDREAELSTLSDGWVRGSLNDNTTILVYWLDDQRSFVWTMTQHGIRLTELPAQSVIEHEIEQLHQHIRTPGADHRTQRSTYALYRQLIKPIEEYLQGDTLAILPHAGLQTLPFAILPTGQSNALLVDEFDMSLLRSLGQLPRREAETASPREVLVFANPDLGTSTGQFPPLPGTKSEIAHIRDALGPSSVEVFSGKDATSDAFLDAVADQPRAVLHLATHAFAGSRNRRLSAILMAADNSNPQNRGFATWLTPEDIWQLELQSPLVVLSACETAVGPSYRYDGVQGLHRAFLDAGAEAIVASLWPADDSATATLMGDFYKRMAEPDAIPFRALSATLRNRATLLTPGQSSNAFWATWTVYSDSLP